MARPYLGNPKYTIEVLQKYHFVFQKRFGQNFLIDEHVLEKIIESSGITKDDFILEIGPGIGTMTQYLAEAAREVAAVEIDSSLIPILKDTLKDWDNVSVINNDILKTDIKKIADEKNGGKLGYDLRNILSVEIIRKYIGNLGSLDIQLFTDCRDQT